MIAMSFSTGDTARFLREETNYQEFAAFLSARNVALRNERDAQTICTAFSDIHQLKSWNKGGVHVKISENCWRLNLQGSGEYYYEVKTDQDGAVVSGRQVWPE